MLTVVRKKKKPVFSSYTNLIPDVLRIYTEYDIYTTNFI